MITLRRLRSRSRFQAWKEFAGRRLDPRSAYYLLNPSTDLKATEGCTIRCLSRANLARPQNALLRGSAPALGGTALLVRSRQQVHWQPRSSRATSWCTVATAPPTSISAFASRYLGV